MSSRRSFMRQVAGGAAMAVSGLVPSGRILGANDRVRMGLIGAGGRGTEDFRAAMRAPNTEMVAAADVYSRRLDNLKRYAPNIKTYSDFRRLLDDKSIDAVIIATPQHQHALNFVPAIQAGKDIYQEKTMAFNPDHARRMRHAFMDSGRVVQVGIQSTSTQAQQRAHELVHSQPMGNISAIHSHMYRDAAYGGWKREIPDDCDEQHVDWKAFQGEAAYHPFDGNRVINWRFYWDYSGGNVFENMVHQVGFWYKAMDLHIPQKVTMCGATYFSAGMEVPDTMNVSMLLPEKILFTWNSGFGSSFYDADEVVLGTDGAVVRKGDERVEYVPKAERRRHHGQGAATTTSAPVASAGKAADIVGGGDETELHMQNFLDCVRSRKEPNCPFEIGFRSAVACQMAVQSYRLGREVQWNTETEEIV